MSEDYTYEPVVFVPVPREDLVRLLDIEAKVQRGYELYCANAAYVGCGAMSFDEWLTMLAGDEEERGGAADSSFARARIREALGDGEEVQP